LELEKTCRKPGFTFTIRSTNWGAGDSRTGKQGERVIGKKGKAKGVMGYNWTYAGGGGGGEGVGGRGGGGGRVWGVGCGGGEERGGCEGVQVCWLGWGGVSVVYCFGWGVVGGGVVSLEGWCLLWGGLWVNGDGGGSEGFWWVGVFVGGEVGPLPRPRGVKKTKR